MPARLLKVPNWCNVSAVTSDGTGTQLLVEQFVHRADRSVPWRQKPLVHTASTKSVNTACMKSDGGTWCWQFVEAAVPAGFSGHTLQVDYGKESQQWPVQLQ